jgi:thiamine biosynthesis protein ThiS
MKSSKPQHYRTKEIEVEKNITVEEILNALHLSSAPILLSVNGEVSYLDEIKDRKLVKGDKLLIIPLVGGG